MFTRFIQYIKDSVAELKKVVWPTRRETTKQTLLVIAISLGVAAFLGIVDFILTKILERII